MIQVGEIYICIEENYSQDLYENEIYYITKADNVTRRYSYCLLYKDPDPDIGTIGNIYTIHLSNIAQSHYIKKLDTRDIFICSVKFNVNLQEIIKEYIQ